MKRLKKNERGAALLEAAITVPIILLISVGIFEFGKAYQTWQVLTNASREGARFAVIEGVSDADVRKRVGDYLKSGGLKAVADDAIAIDRNVALTAASTGSQIQINY